MRGILFLIVLILGLVALFTFQNATPVEVHFLGFAWTAQLLGVIAAAFTAGALAGYLVGIPSSWAKSRRIRDLEREAADRAAKPPVSPPPAASPDKPAASPSSPPEPK
jgi:uncharacterized integral membrane protein